LSVAQILRWADFYHERTGQWPKSYRSRFVYNAVDEKWVNIDAALRNRFRGLEGKSSLAQLLAERRGVRNKARLPPFSVNKILTWADAYYRRHRKWPTAKSGPIPEAPGETWNAVQSALNNGCRGLAGGSSIARLLEKYRAVRNVNHPPRLTYEKILAWADAFHGRKDEWAKRKSGAIDGQPGETWSGIDTALFQGHRGLPGGVTLAQFLQRHRGAPNRMALPRLSEKQILSWADGHHERTGHWPHRDSGRIPEAPGETWALVSSALVHASRGLSKKSSLAQLLVKYRGVRNVAGLPKLTIKQILSWADHFHRMNGRWPGAHAGSIPSAMGETWMNLENALRHGLRGLPGGSSLSRFLKMHLLKMHRRIAATS